MPTRLQISRKDILTDIDATKLRVLRPADLASLLAERRGFWRLAQSTTREAFTNFLLEHNDLKEVRLESVGRPGQSILRYIRGTPSPYALALSIRPNSYLSHGTALSLHGLTDQLPKTLYVNREQSPKPQGKIADQKSVDRAFASRQRQSTLIFQYLDSQFVVLSGKQTGNLEVGTITDSSGAELRVTNLERTLIDIAVRPSYAGGVYEVLRAYEAAKDRMSINVLLATLKKLEYTYPYHQAIGFYMSRAGYDSTRTDKLRKLGLHWDFYLTHSMKERDFDPFWRLHLPKGF